MLHNCAGQGVVQMARSKHNGLEYAIKFYVSRSAFTAEFGLYSQRTSQKAAGLAQFLPEVLLSSRKCEYCA